MQIGCCIIQQPNVKKPTAIFTIVRNEPFFLRIWCNYYSQFGWDVYVLDNSSTDGSAQAISSTHPAITVINQPSPLAFDHQWLQQTVNEFQRTLLKQYEIVIFAEADEFLICSAPEQTLGDYVEKFRNTTDWARRTLGYAVVHDIDNEPSLTQQPGELILENRNQAYMYLPASSSKQFNLPYDKTLICREPAQWTIGFHTTPRQPQPDPALVLLHLQQVDIDVYVDRHVDRLKMASKNVFHGSNVRQDVKTFFRHGQQPWDGMKIYNKRLPMLPHWKMLLRG
jgi:hypothetical protein